MGTQTKKGKTMKANAILTRVKWNKGTLESGQGYDYTRVTIQMPIYDQSANEFGVDMMECEYGTSDQHVELLPFRGRLPLEIECDMTQSMRRGKPVTLIANIKPVKPEPVK